MLCKARSVANICHRDVYNAVTRSRSGTGGIQRHVPPMSTGEVRTCGPRAGVVVMPFRGCSTHLSGSSASSASVVLNQQDSMAPQTPPKRLQVSELDFGNHKFAFSHKTTLELLRGLLVLRACSINMLVNHSYKLLTVGERLLGPRVLGWFVSPFYNQFVAGDSDQEVAVVSKRLADVGVRLMIAPMLETDVGEGHDFDAMYDTNLEKTLFLIDATRRHCAINTSRPICQTKHTAHLSADVLARVSKAYEALSETQRLDVVRLVASLMRQSVQESNSFTSIDDPDILHPLALQSEDVREVLGALPRFYKLGEMCVKKDVTLAVDAEYTYTNPAINLFTLAMMNLFNTPTPIIWNTYQGYMKAGRDNLEHDLRLVSALENTGFGAKIVRGAYLEHERSLAEKEGHPDPINDTYEDTSRMYDSMVDVMLQEVLKQPTSRSVIVASHNEASVRKAAQKIQNLGLNPHAGNVVFGQVYGMAENISLPLARTGFLVYKSIPYGSMTEVLPYLSRRANENRAVLLGARRERQLLIQELFSRVWS